MHILFCVNKSKFGTKCFVKREQFVLPFISYFTLTQESLLVLSPIKRHDRIP